LKKAGKENTKLLLNGADLLAIIPVLMYHHVNPNDGDMITVTPEAFESHLKSIRDGNYRTLSLAELRGFMDGSFRCRERALVITFDDGYLDNFAYAFALLKKYNQRAVIFTPTGWLDGASSAPLDNAGLNAFYKKPPTHNKAKSLVARGAYSKAIMDWNMARAMKDSGLVEFASHTVSHIECDRLPDKILERELMSSKKRLEEELQAPCEAICWPRGKFSERAIKIAAEVGYRACFTTNHGVVHEDDNPMNINRIVVKAGPTWVGKRLAIYTNPVLCRLYLGVKGRSR